MQEDRIHTTLTAISETGLCTGIHTVYCIFSISLYAPHTLKPHQLGILKSQANIITINKKSPWKQLIHGVTDVVLPPEPSH